MANGPAPMRTVTSIEGVVGNWPWASAKAAKEMVETYGLPHEASPSFILWHYNGPWKRSIVWRDGVYHNFPRAHIDVLEQTLSYRVSDDKIAPLMAYNGSIVINKTRGEMMVCCANESMNFLAMNLAHEVVLGQLTPEQAIARHREVVTALRLGWPEPYAEAMQFEVMTSEYGTEESGEGVKNVSGPFHRH